MYRNAARILPYKLLSEIQKYVEGQEIYIPKRDQERVGWGESNGTRAYLSERNRSIFQAYESGSDIDVLMAEYHLSYDSIRKIVQKARRERGVFRSQPT